MGTGGDIHRGNANFVKRLSKGDAFPHFGKRGGGKALFLAGKRRWENSIYPLSEARASALEGPHRIVSLKKRGR